MSNVELQGIAMTELLMPELTEMLDARQNHLVRETLIELYDAEIADLLSALDARNRVLAFLLLPRERAANVFTFLPLHEQERLLAELKPDQLATLFEAMAPDDRVALFDELPHKLADSLLALLRPEQRAQTQILLNYPPHSVGRVMTTQFITLEPDWTVAQASDHIRRHAKEAETLETIFVTDRRGKLIDDVRLRQLFLAAPEARIDTLIDGNVVSLRATADREEAVRVFEKYDRPVLAVVDDHNILIGNVTFDDVADVAEQEMTEDLQKIGGMEALDVPYMESSIWTLFRKRGVWLSVLFLGEMLTATAMQFFEKEIKKAAVLALFLPLIISSGGNSGSQASTLVIRAMALGEVRRRDWSKVLRREVACGLLLGLLLGVMGLLRIHVWEWLNFYDYGGHYHLVGYTVAVALIGVVLWGTIMGSMLPLILRRLGLDPATISAPLVATLVDVTGLIIYFTTALLILRGTLL
jgi:magnesium transporter